MSKTIFVVDDSDDFLRALTPLLVQAGYVVVTAKDGEEALTKLASSDVSFEAAIIDLAMPGIGGFQVLGELGRAQRNPIPMLAITGSYGDLYLEVARYLGANESMRKPDPGQPLTPILEALKRIVGATK